MKRKMRKSMIILAAAVITGMIGLSGCSQSGRNTEAAEAVGQAEASKTEAPSATETGEPSATEIGGPSATETSPQAASADETKTEEMKTDKTEKEKNADVNKTEEKIEQAIIVVSFGTSYNESRDATIGAIEQDIADAFPEFAVYRAFTSQIIIDKLKERDGLEIDNIEQALERTQEDGIKRLVVQPTHLMDGFEYMDVEAALEEYKDKFEEIILAKPLLTEAEDYQAVAQALMEITSSYYDKETAICFMGHGTEAESNAVYPRLQEELTKENAESCPYYIGTVEAEPSLEDVMAALKESGSYQKVVLQPLMVVAGDHANNDMAGDEEDSWKTILEAEGYEVNCVLKGLGEFQPIRDIYVAHTQAAVDRLK